MRRQQPEAEKPGPARYHQYLSSKDDRTGRRCIETSVLESGYTGNREDTHTHTETVIDEKRVQTLLSMTLARHPNVSVYTQVSKADLFDFIYAHTRITRHSFVCRRSALHCYRHRCVAFSPKRRPVFEIPLPVWKRCQAAHRLRHPVRGRRAALRAPPCVPRQACRSAEAHQHTQRGQSRADR